MIIYVFGNPDLVVDSLPLRILPALRQRFPTLTFSVIDPNEEWEIPEELIILDTVLGIKAVQVFTDLKNFSPAPQVSLHDFDAYANLRYLQKLGKLKQVSIIGVPPGLLEGRAADDVTAVLHKLFSRRKNVRLPGFDYSQAGYYFITICTQDERCLFGEVQNGAMTLNVLGMVVQRYWQEIPKHYQNVELDAFVIMPNHMHGIIVINEGDVTKNNNVGAINNRPYGLLSRVVKSFKNVTTKEIKSNGNLNFQWQKSFYDHVIRDEPSLETIREYIINNPLQWELDTENPNN